MSQFCPPRFTASLLLAVSAFAGGTAGAATVIESGLLERGARIYLHGVLGDGAPLSGTRGDGVRLHGQQAACVTCHRRSGLGSVEGETWIPPVTSRALFGGAGPEVVVRTTRRFNVAVSKPQPPRTDTEIGELIHHGKGVGGRELSPLMPRYALADGDRDALLAYLHQLGKLPAPGVTSEAIHIATVITPDVGAEDRNAVLSTLRSFVQSRNVSQLSGMRKRIPREERLTHSRRRWEHHAWQLAGPADTWAAQLTEFQRQQPVFALISGTSSQSWQPVADFCDQARVACWFPSVENPPSRVVAESLGVYFSAGAALDGQAIAEAIRESGVKSVVITGDDSTAARTGSRALRDHLPAGLRWRELAAASLDGGSKPLVSSEEALVVFGGRDFASRLSRHPAPALPVWWAAGDDPEAIPNLPSVWRQRITRVDRFEQDPLRQANLRRFRDWARVSSLPVTRERLQAEAFFAAGAFASGVTDALNNLQPEYLVERVQDTLSMRESEALQMQIQNLMMGGGGGHRPAAAMPQQSASMLDQRNANLELQRQRGSTTHYPRLSLGPDQHFASKGAYLVPPEGPARWIIPGRNQDGEIQSKPASVDAGTIQPKHSQGATP